MPDSQLVIPIYLDTSALLDLLASSAGGFSLVEKITTRTASSTGSGVTGGTEFGIANVLSILRINLRASASSTRVREAGEARESERYHTYGSLLHQLRGLLEDAAVIRRPSSPEEWATVKPSDFVEIRGRFIPNPLAASLKMLSQLLSMVRLVGGLDLTPKTQQERKQDQIQVKQFEQLQKFFDGLIKDFESSQVQTFVIHATVPPDHRAVVSLFPDYLRDRSVTEIPDAEFTVLGKVVRNLGAAESINLLRGSALSGLSGEILAHLLAAFRNMGEQGIQIPNLVTMVEAPALQIVPISVFV